MMFLWLQSRFNLIDVYWTLKNKLRYIQDSGHIIVPCFLISIIMEYIRLYRRFYRIEASSISDTYNLINPEIISVKSYIKDTATLVETVSTIVQESAGVYYVDLDFSLYSIDNTYDLVWNVKYISTAPEKNLKTSFRLYYSDTSIYIQNIETEIISQPIEINIIA